MLRRRALIGAIIAILGIAAAPAVSYSAGARATKTETRAEKLRKALKACKKDKHKSKVERKRCVTTVPPPRPSSSEEVQRRREAREAREREERAQSEEALSATIIVHVFASYAQECTLEQAANHKCEPSPEEGVQLRVSRLGSADEAASSIDTSEHTVHVAPGRYEVALTVDTAYKPQQVTVTAGQTQEVTIEILRK